MGASSFEMRHRTAVRPRRIAAGEVAFHLPQTTVWKREEIALTIAFMAHRRLFGLAYSGIQPDYFYNMPQDSGIYLYPIIQTSELAPGALQPGDIDLLVIPYERDELILHRTVAFEIKAIRARYENQGKSPNEFGISQARGLLSLGFPYVAVAHLIVSDSSPEDAWREVKIGKILNRQGLVEMLPSKPVDLMPMDLTQRAFGRLSKAGLQAPEVGLISAYLGSSHLDLIGEGIDYSTWHPACRRASPNSTPSKRLLETVAALFEQRAAQFLDTPRFDPI